MRRPLFHLLQNAFGARAYRCLIFRPVHREVNFRHQKLRLVRARSQARHRFVNLLIADPNIGAIARRYQLLPQDLRTHLLCECRLE